MIEDLESPAFMLFSAAIGRIIDDEQRSRIEIIIFKAEIHEIFAHRRDYEFAIHRWNALIF